MEIPHYYARMIYLDRIKPFIDTQIIKVLVGQRRVGKSFMLFQLMDYSGGKMRTLIYYILIRNYLNLILSGITRI